MHLRQIHLQEVTELSMRQVVEVLLHGFKINNRMSSWLNPMGNLIEVFPYSVEVVITKIVQRTQTLVSNAIKRVIWLENVQIKTERGPPR